MTTSAPEAEAAAPAPVVPEPAPPLPLSRTRVLPSAQDILVSADRLYVLGFSTTGGGHERLTGVVARYEEKIRRRASDPAGCQGEQHVLESPAGCQGEQHVVEPPDEEGARIAIVVSMPEPWRGQGTGGQGFDHTASILQKLVPVLEAAVGKCYLLVLPARKTVTGFYGADASASPVELMHDLAVARPRLMLRDEGICSFNSKGTMAAATTSTSGSPTSTSTTTAAERTTVPLDEEDVFRQFTVLGYEDIKDHSRPLDWSTLAQNSACPAKKNYREDQATSTNSSCTLSSSRLMEVLLTTNLSAPSPRHVFVITDMDPDLTGAALKAKRQLLARCRAARKTSSRRGKEGVNVELCAMFASGTYRLDCLDYENHADLALDAFGLNLPGPSSGTDPPSKDTTTTNIFSGAQQPQTPVVREQVLEKIRVLELNFRVLTKIVSEPGLKKVCFGCMDRMAAAGDRMSGGGGEKYSPPEEVLLAREQGDMFCVRPKRCRVSRYASHTLRLGQYTTQSHRRCTVERIENISVGLVDDVAVFLSLCYGSVGRYRSGTEGRKFHTQSIGSHPRCSVASGAWWRK